MTERPILFSGEMVRAILAGTKTQTRRIITPQPETAGVRHPKFEIPNWNDRAPYAPGNRLWVRETFYVPAAGSTEFGIGYRADHPTGDLSDGDGGYNFRAFSDDPEQAGEQWKWVQMHCNAERWRPPIHMPRWASRITLEVVSVRPERLQDITEEDAHAEGCVATAITPEHTASIDDSRMHALSKALEGGSLTTRLDFQFLWDSMYGPSAWDTNPWVWRIEFNIVETESLR